MTYLFANYFRNLGQLKIQHRLGQLKIQQMAFVLVALMIFFGIVVLFYVTIRFSNLENVAGNLDEEDARQLVKKIASSSEFAYTAVDCSNCIDMDKVLFLKEQKTYSGFWRLDYLQVEVLGGNGIECSKFNYPECSKISIIESRDFGSVVSSFVSLCSWEGDQGGYSKCELGRISVSGRGIRND
jgi:hypothetical protein